MRPGEVDGRDYYFISKEDFRARIARGEFIEHAEVFGNLYGTLRQPMEAALLGGKIYLLEIDVQGALQLKTLHEPGLYIFIAPPDFVELRRRLVKRNTETTEVLERRLHKAEDEYRERDKYDHVVVNDDLERAVAEVRALIGLS
jgi:guanylate kinase